VRDEAFVPLVGRGDAVLGRETLGARAVARADRDRPRAGVAVDGVGEGGRDPTGTEDPPADRRGRTRVFSEAHAHTLAAPGPGSSSGLLLGRLLRGGLLGGGLLGGRLLRGRLARSALLGPLRTLVREQLDGLVEGDRLDREVPRQGAVGLAVGDVGAETAVLDDDRLARGRVLAELAQRRRRRLTPAPLGL